MLQLVLKESGEPLVAKTNVIQTTLKNRRFITPDMSWGNVMGYTHARLVRQGLTLIYFLGNLVCYHRLTCHPQQAHYECAEATD